MNKPRLKIFGNYRFNSIFARTFLILVVLTVIIMVFFYTLTSKLLTDNYRDRIKATNLSLLSKTSDSLDQSLMYTSEQMTSLMRDKNVTGVMVAPDIDNYERNSNAARMISNVPENNDLVKGAFLYVPSANIVVTSNFTIEDKLQFKDAYLIDDYLSDPEGMGSFVSDNGFTTRIRVIGGRILMFQDYPPTVRIGTMVFELDPEKIFEMLQGKGNYSERSIYVFDIKGDPLFPELIDYPSIDLKAGKTVFTYQSEKTKWKYVLKASSESMTADPKAALVLILPSMLLLLIISVGLSSYVLYSMYAPITDLMNSINNPDLKESNKNRNKKAKNEIDFLKLIYANALGKSQQLSSMIESVSPEILQKLLGDILSGKISDDKYVRDTLESMGKPLDMDGRYAVITVKQSYREGKKPNAVEMKLYNLSMDKTLQSLLKDRCKCFILTADESQQIYILSFNAKDPVMQVKNTIFELCRELAEKLAQLPFNAIIGRGKLCSNIMELRMSYEDAQKDLCYRAYYGLEQTEMLEAKNADENQEISNILYYKARMNIMLQNVSEGISESADQITSFVREISRTISDSSEAGQVYEAIIEVTVDKMASMRISEDKLQFKDKEYSEHLRSFSTVQEMQQYVQAFLSQAAELIGVYGQKGRNKYIEQAKEFIADNYSNSNLSLSMVSDSIGINEYYLSHLFNESLNQGFVDYLNLYRVEKAKNLLEVDKVSISDIGFKTGFNSSQNFIRVFKKYTGTTPGKYREKYAVKSS